MSCARSLILFPAASIPIQGGAQLVPGEKQEEWEEKSSGASFHYTFHEVFPHRLTFYLVTLK